MRAYLLDASALLAWLHEEPGAGFVDAILEQSAISSVNLGEVLYKTESSKQQAGDLLALGLQVIPFCTAHALELPALRATDRTRQQEARARRVRVQTLSLADLCCLATGVVERRPVVTADTYWSELGVSGLSVIDYRTPPTG